MRNSSFLQEYLEEGRQQGLEQGIQQGQQEGRCPLIEASLDILENRFQPGVVHALKPSLEAIGDIDRLK